MAATRLVIRFAAACLLAAFAGSATAQSSLEECRTPAEPFGGENGTPVSIVDVMNVTDDFVIGDLQVTVEITHPFIADVVLDIISPAGTSLRLHDGTGGDADDIDVIYDDEGVANGSEPYDFGCLMQPGVGTLSIFDGESTAGEWSLSILDDYPSNDDGVLESWCLRAFDSEVPATVGVTALVCAVTSDGVELSWSNPVAYDNVVVTVNGAETTLPGSATDYTITGQPANVPIDVSVVGVLGASVSCEATCTVVPFGTLTPMTERLVLVLIDGLRYSEGLGHPTRAYVPNMDALSAEGAIIEPFLNDGQTVTIRGVPAVMCGSWQQPINFFDPECDENNQYAAVPYIHEYYRRQLDRPEEDCVYILGPYCPWRASFHPAYGPDYWPDWVATSGGDDANWVAALDVLETSSPRFLTLYLPDTDTAGHSGDWDTYITAIQNADAIIGELWTWLQQDPDYAGATTMVITNDHGRHDYDFTGHGDGCVGCRTMQLLALGPGIKSGFVSNVERSIPDIVPTIGALLGVQTEYADGEVMTEIFELQEWRRGDVNGDAITNLADGIAGLTYLFNGGVAECLDAVDANDDGELDISDPLWLVGYLFAGGAAPPEPFPGCGSDPTPDGLGCASYGGCP